MRASLPLFLAFITPPDGPVLLWLIVAALIALGPALRSWLYVLDRLRGKRPDEEMFVTRREYLAAKAERDKQIDGSMAEIRSSLRDITSWLLGDQRAIGRLESSRPPQAPIIPQ